MKAMRFLLLLCFAGWGSLATLRAQAVVPADSSMVRCVVRSLKTTYKYREPIGLDVQLISQAKQPVMLVDGEISSEIWEYFTPPELEVCRLGKNGPGDKVIRANRPGDLSFGVKLENLVVLQPNQLYPLLFTQEPYSWALISSVATNEPLRPGRYMVRFVYSTTVSNNGNLNEMIYQLAGARVKTQESLKAIIDQIPVVRAVSVPFYLTITR